MVYNWTEDLAVGHSQIDADHKQLYRLVDTLFEAMRSGKGNAMLGGILDELVRYTVSHFAREEKLMQQIGYPSYADHKSAHEALTLEVQSLQRRFQQGSVALSLDVFKFLGEWLRNHIMTHDKLLGVAVQGG